jgi:uncharacterized protein YdeI (YjbR/CyaY-like superfamily)
MTAPPPFVAHSSVAMPDFSAQAPSYRRAAIHWVTSAKRTETRERRLDRLIVASARAERAF